MAAHSCPVENIEVGRYLCVPAYVHGFRRVTGCHAMTHHCIDIRRCPDVSRNVKAFRRIGEADTKLLTKICQIRTGYELFILGIPIRNRHGRHDIFTCCNCLQRSLFTYLEKPRLLFINIIHFVIIRSSVYFQAGHESRKIVSSIVERQHIVGHGDRSGIDSRHHALDIEVSYDLQIATYDGASRYIKLP